MSGLSLNFGEVESNREVKGSEGQVQRITPGIHENVTITGVVESETANGKKLIKVSFLGSDGAVLDAELSTEGGAVPYTLKKLKHLMTKFVDEATANSATSVDSVNKILTGKKYRIKFNGEEYLNKEGVKRVKTTLGLPNFAENSELDKEFSKLRFDSTNNYDVKRINQATMESNSLEAKSISDLPF